MDDDRRQTLVDICDDEPANLWTVWFIEQVDTLNATMAAILASQTALYNVLTGVSAENPSGTMALNVIETNAVRPTRTAYKGAQIV